MWRAPVTVVQSRLYPRVGHRIVTVQCVNIGGYERLDGVAHALGDLGKWDAGSQPGGGCGVPAVVDAQEGSLA